MIAKKVSVSVSGLACVQELRERVLHGKYRVPYQMSTNCENLIGKLLVLNPAKRACLEVRRTVLLTCVL